MGEWQNGRVAEWASGKMGECANGKMGEWQNGRMCEWPIRTVHIVGTLLLCPRIQLTFPGTHG